MYNLHTIKVTHFKCTIQQFLSKFTELGEHDNNSVLEAFRLSRKIFHDLSQAVYFLLPPPKATTNLLCVSIDLPVLEISHN